ncbi:MAG: FAD:protein FMN transferase [Bacillales bacterium]|nr:FAD:protein FMN transferase [Bacillales bacterium]
MRKYSKFLSFLTIPVLLFFVFALSSCALKDFTIAYSYFDTIITLKIYAKSEKEAETVFDYTNTVLKEYHILFNRYEEETGNEVGIFTINENAGETITISRELYDAIDFAINEGEKIVDENSHPYFTIGIGKISDLWHPIFSEYNEATSCGSGDAVLPDASLLLQSYDTDVSKIEMNEENLTIKIPSSMSLDMGGVAKGYVSEILSSYYEENDIKYILNAGSSNIKTNIGNPSRKNNQYIVALQNPASVGCDALDEAKSYYATIILPLNYSIITSGDYQQYITYNSKRYCHILDSNTNYPVDTDIRAVTIIMENGALGDIYSTAIFMMGLEKGYDFVINHEGVEAIFYTTSNQVVITPGLKDIVTVEDGFELIDYGS